MFKCLEKGPLYNKNYAFAVMVIVALVGVVVVTVMQRALPP